MRRKYNVDSMGDLADHVLRICDPCIPGLFKRLVVDMSAKLRVSYERPEELRRILDKLGSDVKSWKAAKKQEGPYKKAYIEIVEQRANNEKMVK